MSNCSLAKKKYRPTATITSGTIMGEIRNAMIVGKGSLFLGRMTNLFDGVSFVIEPNDGKGSAQEGGVSEAEVKGMIAKAMKEFATSLMAQAE